MLVGFPPPGVGALVGFPFPFPLFPLFPGWNPGILVSRQDSKAVVPQFWSASARWLRALSLVSVPAALAVS